MGSFRTLSTEEFGLQFRTGEDADLLFPVYSLGDEVDDIDAGVFDGVGSIPRKMDYCGFVFIVGGKIVEVLIYTGAFEWTAFEDEDKRIEIEESVRTKAEELGIPDSLVEIY